MSDIDFSKMWSSNGKFLGENLILELGWKADVAIYTISNVKSERNEGLTDLRELYLSCEDPTEYEFALKAFGSWKAWKGMRNNKRVLPFLEEWREEAEIKLKSEMVSNMISLADEGAFQATKFVYDLGGKAQVGRPKKDTQARDKRIKEVVASEFADDLARMSGVMQ